MIEQRLASDEKNGKPVRCSHAHDRQTMVGRQHGGTATQWQGPLDILGLAVGFVAIAAT